MCLTSTLTDKFQYHGQSIDAENIPPWDKIKNVYITGSLLFLFLIQFLFRWHSAERGYLQFSSKLTFFNGIYE
jgi:hypothetical protein